MRYSVEGFWYDDRTEATPVINSKIIYFNVFMTRVTIKSSQALEEESTSRPGSVSEIADHYSQPCKIYKDKTDHLRSVNWLRKTEVKDK